jgi:hypothetical protein
MPKKGLVLSALLAAAAGCDNPAGDDEGRVAIRFAASTASRSAAVSPSFSGSAQALLLTGTNGTLRIEDIRMIVSEFELERAEGSCVEERDDDDCEEFEGGPFLLGLPLAGGSITLTRQEIPAGTYTELEFEVEDLDADEDDDGAERQAIQGLLATLRADYPGFPSGASMVVRGTFTPTGGSPQPFTVYFDAEIEVEKELVPPVEVPDTEALTVNVDPGLWFRSGGQVMNLAVLNGKVVEFEAKLGEGFGKVEIDD